MSNNIQNMQIFTIIGQIEDMVENSPRPKIGGANKRVIDVEEMMDLLGDLKVTIPEDIRRANSVIVDAQSMIDNADEHARDVVSQAETDGEKIVADAKQKAADIIEKARSEYERLVSEDIKKRSAERSCLRRRRKQTPALYLKMLSAMRTMFLRILKTSLMSTVSLLL